MDVDGDGQYMDPMSKYVEKAAGWDKIPNDLQMKMKAESSKVGRTLRALGRSKIHQARLLTKMAELDAGKLPAGFKIWKPRDDSDVWKSPLGSSSNGLPFGITAETTIEEAKTRLNLEMHRCNLIVDIKLEQERVSELEKSGSLTMYLQKCEILAAPFRIHLERTATGLGSAPAMLVAGLDEAVKQEAVKLFRWQLESAARDSRKQEATSERQSQEQKDELARAAKLSPVEVVGRAFAEFAKNGQKKTPKSSSSKPTVDYMKMLKFDVDAPTLVETKNGLTPQAAGGQNSKKHSGQRQQTKNDGKAKGKGKSNGAATKGSGKGSGKGKGQGKGQGKNPGNGQNKDKGKGKGAGNHSGKPGGKGKSKGKGAGGRGAGNKGRQ